MAKRTRQPYWQTEPCPPWCEEIHNDDDPIGARQHFGTPDAPRVLMTLAEGRAIGVDHLVIEPTCAVSAWQRVSDAAPRFAVEWPGTQFELTAAEARKLAKLLIATVKMTEASSQ